MNEELLKKIFLAGFKISGEGWNGEYPYLDRNASDSDIWEAISPHFTKAIYDLLLTEQETQK